MGQRIRYRTSQGIPIRLDEDDVVLAGLLLNDGEGPVEVIRQLTASGVPTVEALAAMKMARDGHEEPR